MNLKLRAEYEGIVSIQITGSVALVSERPYANKPVDYSNVITTMLRF